MNGAFPAIETPYRPRNLDASSEMRFQELLGDRLGRFLAGNGRADLPNLCQERFFFQDFFVFNSSSSCLDASTIEKLPKLRSRIKGSSTQS